MTVIKKHKGVPTAHLRTRIWLYITVGVLLLFAIARVTPHVTKAFKIDRCLDRGGAWDYQNNVCRSSADRDSINKCLIRGGTWDFQSRQCTLP
jgi:hypothetical protein